MNRHWWCDHQWKRIVAEVAVEVAVDYLEGRLNVFGLIQSYRHACECRRHRSPLIVLLIIVGASTNFDESLSDHQGEPVKLLTDCRWIVVVWVTYRVGICIIGINVGVMAAVVEDCVVPLDVVEFSAIDRDVWGTREESHGKELWDGMEQVDWG